jgi:RND family efflux transporter MFP subunit
MSLSFLSSPHSRIAAIVASVAALGVIGCTKRELPVAPVVPPILVELAPVTYSEAAVPVRVTGVLSRKAEADLAFKIGGIVEEIAVRAGDRVTKGQLLARLRLDEIDAQLLQAQTSLAKAERDLARVEKLQANAVATLENLQDARSVVDVAAAQVKIAEFNRRYAVITAPADGQILRRAVEPNELVSAGKVILAFAADDEGWLVRAGVADADLTRVRVGDRAEISLGGTDIGGGKVTHISGAADTATRTTGIEIALDSAPAAARSGMVVTARVMPQPVAPRPVVPASVLIEGQHDTASVYLVQPGSDVARRQVVELEALDGERAFLRTALPREARVVVSGGEFLRDGGRVTVAQP